MLIEDPGVNYRNYNAGLHSLYLENEQWLQTVQVVRAVLAILTIPLTSTVCSKAAVAYVQRTNRAKISLRQTMALADRGRTDPVLYYRMPLGDFKKYATKLLIGAIILNILGEYLMFAYQARSVLIIASGGVISPLQSYFLTTTTIKTPTRPTRLSRHVDILDLFDSYISPDDDENLITVTARSAMTSANIETPQGRLWSRKANNCTIRDPETYAGRKVPNSCLSGQANSTSVNQLTDPFLAQLPVDYNTGLIRQFALRLNSTAWREAVDEDDYPANCDSLPGAFHVNYSSVSPNNATTVMTGWDTWSLTACMPADLRQSPWRKTRDRQDLTEDLYLNISLPYYQPNPFSIPGGLFKVSLNTTAGYFELPNYMNGQQPGKLLDEDPSTTLCGTDCAWQANSFHRKLKSRGSCYEL